MRTGIISFDEGEHYAERERTRAIQQVLKVLEDQVRGLLRVVELFEARKPKGQAIITEVGGKIVDIEKTGLKRVVIHSPHAVAEPVGTGEVLAEDVVDQDSGEVIAAAGAEANEKFLKKLRDTAVAEVVLRKTHLVPYRGNLEVKRPLGVEPATTAEGPLDPQKVLLLQCPGVWTTWGARTRRIKSQGVEIIDKHVEVIVRQMLPSARSWKL